MKTLESVLDTSLLKDAKITKEYMNSICKDMGLQASWNSGILNLHSIGSDITPIFKEHGKILFPNIRFVDINHWTCGLNDVELIGNVTFPQYIIADHDIMFTFNHLKMKDLDFKVKARYCIFTIKANTIEMENVKVRADNLVLHYYSPQKIDLSGLYGKVDSIRIHTAQGNYKFFKDLVYTHILNKDNTPKEDIDQLDLGEVFGLKNITFNSLHIEHNDKKPSRILNITLSKPKSPRSIATPKHYKYYATKKWGIYIGPLS